MNLPRSAGSMGRVLPARFTISQLTAGLCWAAYRARSPANPTRGTPAARIHGRRNPGQFTVAATSLDRTRSGGHPA
jgi:hypothetical protein